MFHFEPFAAVNLATWPPQDLLHWYNCELYNDAINIYILLMWCYLQKKHNFPEHFNVILQDGY